MKPSHNWHWADWLDYFKENYAKAARRRYGLDLLDENGTYLKCAGCNTLTQLEGVDVKEMAEALAKKGMVHLPNCVIQIKSDLEE